MTELEQQELPNPRDIVRFGGRDIGRWPVFHMFFMVLSAVVIGNGLIILGTVDFKVSKEPLNLGGTPAQRFVPLDPDSPRLDPTEAEVKAVVVIAHGFGGSQRMMWPFASTFARNGYAAETFDFPGHGSATTPYTADDTQRLQVLDRVVQDAHTHWPGKPVVLLGHSIGSEAVVKYAHAHHDIAATIGVSLVGDAPPDVRNLLVLTGSWEVGAIKRASRNAIAATGNSAVVPDHDYGTFAQGTARRLVWVPHTEHVTVLWSAQSLREAVAWVDRLTGTPRPTGILTDVRMLGLTIVALGLLWFWWSLCYFLFRRRPLAPLGAHLPWRSVLLISLAAAMLTPVILRLIPIGNFLPLAVSSYLALHFCLYGLLLLAGTTVLGASPLPALRRLSWPQTLWATLLMIALVTIVLGPVTQNWWLNVFPPLRRIPWAFVLFILLLPFWLGDAWLTGSLRTGSSRWAFWVSKVFFIGSLLLAVVINGSVNFVFLVLPIFLIIFVLFGVMGSRLTQRTGNPFPAALGTAAILAWLIAATLPLIR